MEENYNPEKIIVKASRKFAGLNFNNANIEVEIQKLDDELQRYYFLYNQSMKYILCKRGALSGTEIKGPIESPGTVRVFKDNKAIAEFENYEDFLDGIKPTG